MRGVIHIFACNCWLDIVQGRHSWAGLSHTRGDVLGRGVFSFERAALMDGAYTIAGHNRFAALQQLRDALLSAEIPESG